MSDLLDITRRTFAGEALLPIPVFAKAIDKCDAVLKPLGIDIRHVITNKDEATFGVVLNCFVGIAAVQVYFKVFRSFAFYILLLTPDLLLDWTGGFATFYRD